LPHVGLPFRPGEAAVGRDPRRKRDAAAEQGAGIHAHFLAFSPGSGKHMMNQGIQRKIRSRMNTIMMSRISAQMVIIGIDSEQIMPMLTFGLLSHGPLPMDRSLWNGHGRTDSTRSTKPIPLARCT